MTAKVFALTSGAVALAQVLGGEHARAMQYTFIAVAVFHMVMCAYLDSAYTAVEAPVNTDKTKIWREEQGKSVLVPKFFTTKATEETARSDITMAELAKHNTQQDAWICVEGRAYAISSYVPKHPGGWLPIANLAGKDVTDAFANYHPASVYQKLLPSYFIGTIKDYKVTGFVHEHREIRQELLRRGMFETKLSYYVGLWIWYSALFLGGLYFTIMRTSTWEHYFGALLFAAYWQQVAFFGHDVGHNAISHVRSKDLLCGLVIGNLTGGISLGWWKRSHNVHHVVCNSIENDPDIQHMPIMAVDPGMFGKYFSTYHQKTVVTDFAARTLVSYQHWLYYPVMAVARVNLYIQSYMLLLDPAQYTQHRKLELATLVGFATWFSALMYYSLGSNSERLCYFLLSHGLAGVLHVQITLSHFAEECYHGQAYNNESDEWFRMQVRTTLNVDCPTWMDWFHGGLQFQVEHHLFPRLPRHHLRTTRNMVRKLCAKHDIEYHEMGFFEGNMRVIRKMMNTAMEARKLQKGDAGFYSSTLFNGINAIG